MVPDRHMDPYFAEFIPLERTKESRAHMHPGYEFLYILDGELELHHGEHHCTLGPGDAVYFDSSTPHSYVCAGKRPADALIVTMHQPPAAQPVTLLRSGSGATLVQRAVAGRGVLGLRDPAGS
jgi:quercetin dioxygenase-like cupin family protein